MTEEKSLMEFDGFGKPSGPRSIRKVMQSFSGFHKANLEKYAKDEIVGPAPTQNFIFVLLKPPLHDMSKATESGDLGLLMLTNPLSSNFEVSPLEFSRKVSLALAPIARLYCNHTLLMAGLSKLEIVSKVNAQRIVQPGGSFTFAVDVKAFTCMEDERMTIRHEAIYTALEDGQLLLVTGEEISVSYHGPDGTDEFPSEEMQDDLDLATLHSTWASIVSDPILAFQSLLDELAARSLIADLNEGKGWDINEDETATPPGAGGFRFIGGFNGKQYLN